LQLYLDGKMEQFWLRDKEAGVIFLMFVRLGPLLLLGMLMKASLSPAERVNGEAEARTRATR
jgi:hypothetical protein